MQKPNDADSPENYEYHRKHWLVTRNELLFFHTLLKEVDGFYYIAPQIHLSSLLNHKKPGQSWKGALSHIQRKSVDYVICSREKLIPVCAIELDDDSHLRADRQKRDKEVERIFQKAQLPLIRIKTHEQNDVQLLRKKLSDIPKPDHLEP